MQEVTQEIATVQSEDLYNLLQRIKPRPGMYLGRRSISRLLTKKGNFILHTSPVTRRGANTLYP